MFVSEEKKLLISEIEEYNKEIETLKAEIKEIEEKEERLRERTLTEYDWRFAFWEMPVKALKTVFFTDTERIKKGNTVNMSEACFNNTFEVRYDYGTSFHMAVFCEYVYEEKNGMVFVLSDPYKTIRSLPVNISVSAAEACVGKILNIKFKRHYDETAKEQKIELLEYEITPWTLTNYKDMEVPVTDPIAKIALELESITNKEDVPGALLTLSNYIKATDSSCTIGKVSDYEIRIMKGNSYNEYSVLYSIFFYKDELWFAKEEWHENKLCEVEQDDFFMKALNDAFGTDAVEILSKDDTYSNWKFKFKTDTLASIHIY